MSKVLIVGGGAAGMFASIFAAKMAMKSTYLRKMKTWKEAFHHGKRQMQCHQCL